MDVNTEKQNSFITETSIDDTLYTVESILDDEATETAYTKIKKLIISHTEDFDIQAINY